MLLAVPTGQPWWELAGSVPEPWAPVLPGLSSLQLKGAWESPILTARHSPAAVTGPSPGDICPSQEGTEATQWAGSRSALTFQAWAAGGRAQEAQGSVRVADGPREPFQEVCDCVYLRVSSTPTREGRHL